MSDKRIRVGIFFGGASREREISFAGGRTVYDNLDKTLFEPVPLFVDSFNTLILLDWQYIYKGTIRDFYPPADLVGDSTFQYYIENAPNSHDPAFRQACIDRVGRRVLLEELPQLIDFAFLCLHGQWGEDGSIQGLLEWLRIPYSGAGIFGSAFGYDKGKQHRLMNNPHFKTPEYQAIRFTEIEYYFSELYTNVLLENNVPIKPDLTEYLLSAIEYERDFNPIQYTPVLKHPTQGSSIGVQIVRNEEEYRTKILKAFFIEEINPETWQSYNEAQKILFLQELIDIRSGIGIPLYATEDFTQRTLIQTPNELLTFLDSLEKTCYLLAVDYPDYIIVEEFIDGREFSHIVIDSTRRFSGSLPPTEIIKSTNVFDYRSKYLPGIVKKKTPMDASVKELTNIQFATSNLKRSFFLDVYARIDGILTESGDIYLNDPNTTSGMLPSSFFFHQAAEVGFSPKDFITHIIQLSLNAREKDNIGRNSIERMRQTLEALQTLNQNDQSRKQRIGVILGGYTFERHISVESGRNIFEKLNSSAEYAPVPLFLLHNRYWTQSPPSPPLSGGGATAPSALTTNVPPPDKGAPGGDYAYSLWKLPICILLKDNADDIAQKIVQYIKRPRVQQPYNIDRIEAEDPDFDPIKDPEYVPFDQLPNLIDFAFIALHGRPGEDGDLQTVLERLNIPYNGSGTDSSQITIDKFATTELLMQNGLLAAGHFRLQKADWLEDKEGTIEKLESGFREQKSPPSPPLSGGETSIMPPLSGWETSAPSPLTGNVSPPDKGGAGGDYSAKEHIFTLSEMTSFRKELRNNLTTAEAYLWSFLKEKQLDGLKFRRQHSVKSYVLDFYCPSNKLAIELDGSIHQGRSNEIYDAERTAYLNSLGIKVLRFENEAVFEDTESVLKVILENARQSPPVPPLSGEETTAPSALTTNVSPPDKGGPGGDQRLAYPLIGKPVDDGCSSAVKKIPNREALEIYLEMLFRDEENAQSAELRQKLSVGEFEEFPMKEEALLETFVQAGEGERLIEVTVGMLTHRNEDGSLRYEVFEPSETIADGGILSLEEKFLAGEGQNITPARFSPNPDEQKRVSAAVRAEIERAARLLNIEGYCRIDAFVKIAPPRPPLSGGETTAPSALTTNFPPPDKGGTGGDVEVWFIEVNSLPGMTPATVIFHQAALAGYKPFEFIDKIIQFGIEKAAKKE